jgi:hypothetical protein
MEVSGQLHTPAALPGGKELRHLLDRRLDGLQSRSQRCGEEDNLFPGVESQPSGPLLYRLSYHHILNVERMYVCEIRCECHIVFGKFCSSVWSYAVISYIVPV